MTAEDQKKVHEALPYAVPDAIPAKTYAFQTKMPKSSVLLDASSFIQGFQRILSISLRNQHGAAGRSY